MYVWPYPRLPVWILCVIAAAVLQGLITAKTPRFAPRLLLPVFSSIPIFAGIVLAVVSPEAEGTAIYQGFAVALPGVFALIGTVLGFWLGSMVYTLKHRAKGG